MGELSSAVKQQKPKIDLVSRIGFLRLLSGWSIEEVKEKNKELYQKTTEEPQSILRDENKDSTSA